MTSHIIMIFLFLQNLKVRLSIIEAIGYMSPLLPRDKLEEQMPRLFSGINSLYRKHAANQIYTITQVGFRSSYSTRYFSNLPKCAQKVG